MEGQGHSFCGPYGASSLPALLRTAHVSQALGAGLGPALVWPSYTASYQAHVSASKNLAEARKEAREFGEERRKQIRRRVQEYNELKAAQERPPEGEPRT